MMKIIIFSSLAVILAIVFIYIINNQGFPDQREDQTKLMIGQISQAIKLYRSDLKKYPLESKGLIALLKNVEHSPHWKGPYLDKSKASDAWDQSYKYEIVYKIRSAGKDQKFGTSDDILFYSDTSFNE